MVKKGTRSKTRRGTMDYMTKRGDKVYHMNHKYVNKGHKPYGYHKGTASSMFPGLMDFNTKKGNMVFHQKGHNIKIPYKLPFMG
jgi:hypothetical protein